MTGKLVIGASIVGVLLLISLWDPQVAGAIAAIVAVGLITAWYLSRNAGAVGGVGPPPLRIDEAKAAVSDIATVKTLVTMTTTTQADLDRITSDPATAQMLDAVNAAKSVVTASQTAEINAKIQSQSSQLTALFNRANLQLATKSIIGSAVAIGTLGTGESLADLLFLVYSSADFAVGLAGVSGQALAFAKRAHSLDAFTLEASKFIGGLAAPVAARMCAELSSMVGRLAAVLGDIVSLLVPVDPGFLRAGVTTLVLTSSQYAYSGLVGLLRRLPESVLRVLLDPSRLSRWLESVLNSALPDGARGILGTVKGALSVWLAFPVLFVPIVGPFAWAYLTTSGWARVASGTGIDMGRIKKLSDQYLKPRIGEFAKAVSVSANLCLLSLYTASTNCNITVSIPPAGLPNSGTHTR